MIWLYLIGHYFCLQSQSNNLCDIFGDPVILVNVN